ncbi:MAG: hypothetical protein K6E98_11935 [Lachnospiraceae bacterium]|nr:hypothetical protein [Lachnospiraceae bacterium]
MNEKIFVQKILKYTIITLILIAVLIIVIDPFSRYHKPWFGLAAVETDERSSAIGLARNLDYDTVLIGSSMSENYKNTWFEDGLFGNKCVKIALQGAHYDDYRHVLNESINHKGTKNIVFSLDTYLFTDLPSSYPQTIEDYYVSDIGPGDVHYLFNKSVLFDYLPKFIITNIREGFSSENAYVWSEDYEYSKYAARLAYMSSRLLTRNPELPYDVFFETADAFTDPFLEQIRSNPDITYYLYAPPYSILFWDDVLLRGNATATICALEREYKKLLECDNVRLFFFQDDQDIITDLSNYRDYSHYKGEINHYMYQSMHDGTHELTKDNYYDILLGLYNFICEYNYEQCFH